MGKMIRLWLLDLKKIHLSKDVINFKNLLQKIFDFYFLMNYFQYISCKN